MQTETRTSTRAMTIMPENVAISLGTTILLCMTLGGVLTFLGRHMALRGRQ